MSSRKLSFIDTFRGEDMTKRIAQNATTDALTQHLSEAIDHSQMMREDANRATTVTTITQMIGLGIIWSAWCFSDWGSFSFRESIGWRPCQQRNTQTSSRPKWCVR